jgi:hypothetical protein
MQHNKQFWRGLFFLFLIVALCGGMALPAVSLPARAAPQMQTASVAPGDIVISEFRFLGPGGGNDEFIELYNRKNVAVNIAGLKIMGSNNNAGTSERIALGNVTLQPGQYYLLVNNNASAGLLALQNATYSTGITDTGGIALTLADGTTVIDAVGLSSGSAYLEGTPLPPLSGNADQSYERKIAGVTGNCNDTNNNATDFVRNPTSINPQNLSSGAVPCISVTNVTSPTVDNTYTTNASIDITVTFSGIVNVTGSPTLLLETGSTDRTATFVSGSGSNTLTFNYVVAAGDSSGDLDYVAANSLALNGGTITGATGDAILTLPVPGSAGSLGANKNIVIDDGLPPSVTVEQASGQADPANTTPISFGVVFSEPINPSTFTASDITQTGTATSVTWSIADSGNHQSFTLSAVSLIGNNVTVAPSIPAGVVMDVGGTGNLASTSVDNSVTFIDNVGPRITVNQASTQPDPTSILPVNFAVEFSEPINTSTFTASDITQTTQAGAATGITWAIAPTNDPRNFTLRATAVTGAGIIRPSILVGTVTDLAGNSNVDSTSTDNSVTFNTTATGSATSVVISEFRTRGPSSAEDEFVEIYNPTANPVDIGGWILSASNSSGATQNRATIPASTLLRSGQYYLIAHNNYVVPNQGVTPNLRYGTSIANNGGIALLNASGEIIDEVGMDSNSFYQEGTPLSPLSGTSNGSYERKDGGALDSCVDDDNNASDFSGSNSGTIHNYSSPLSLCGTARPAPGTTTTRIASDNPDPSTVNGNVSVSVTVTGGATTPTGKVNITGANTNCTITLNSAGTGSCTVKFTSSGIKTLTATYLGDNTHSSSSDTESHQVGTSVVRTPTRVPTLRPPPPLIAINEFVPRPGHDWNADGVINVGDEFVELINHGVVDVNLSGYTLDDEVNIGSTPFRLPSVTMRPGERRVFYGSETGLLLSDGGDGVRLIMPNGQLGDAFNYRVVRFPDQSYCRLPDNGGLDDWTQNCFPTPGLQNSLGSAVNPPTSGDVNELCPIADTLPLDFVLAECPPFGNNIWNPEYWDQSGWFDERFLPESPGKWNVFVD